MFLVYLVIGALQMFSDDDDDDDDVGATLRNNRDANQTLISSFSSGKFSTLRLIFPEISSDVH